MAGVENSFNKKEIKDNLNSLPNGVITAPFVNGNAEILRANTTILTTYTLQALDLSRIIRIPSSVTTDFDITIPQSFTGPSARRFVIINESDAVVRLVIDGTLTLNYATDPFVLIKNTLFDIYRVSSLNYVVVNSGGATPQAQEETIATSGTTALDFSFDSFGKITQTGSIVIDGTNTSGTKQINKSFLIQGSENVSHTITFPNSWTNLSGVSADSTKMNFIEIELINGSVVYSINKYAIPDVVTPTLLKASLLLESLNTIELLYSEAIDSSVTTQTSWYNVVGKTVSSVSILSNKVRVVVSVPFAETDSTLVTFTNQVVGNGIQDASGNKVADFSQTIGLTTYRTDNFNRANSTTSVNSPSDSGSDWVTPFGATWGINTNKAYCFGANTTTAQANAIYLESSESNVTLRAKFTLGTSGVSSSTSFITRYVDTNNYYLVQFGKTNTGNLFYSVTKVVAGTGTTIVSTTNFETWVNGTEYTFMLKFSGNTLTLYNGTTSLAQVVDSSVVGTKHGLRLFSGSGSSGNTDRFDDFGVYYG